ncbi:MAG TPA: hypothetical protein VFU36_10820 [Jatrophihabitans sp.]|nr:hypothetical protein [Jatrophihabitans sp.]
MAHLQQRADEARGLERLPALTEGEGLVVAELLDELSAVYPRRAVAARGRAAPA